MFASSALLFELLIGILAFIFWKRAVILVMYWILVVGAARKWILPQYSDALFLLQYIVLSGIYMRALLDRKLFRYVRLRNLALILVFVAWGILSLFAPTHPSIQIGLIGLAVHFFYVPLAFVVPHVFPSKDRLMKFLKTYALCSVPLLILGIYQFFNPASDRINSYVGEGGDIAIVGDHARITSTFSYISGYASYLNALILLLTFQLSLPRQSKPMTLALYALMSLSVLNLLMTGSRGPVAVTVISVTLYFVVSGSLGMKFVRGLSTKILLLLFTLLIVLANTEAGRSAYSAYMQRHRSGEDLIPRALSLLTPFKSAERGGLVGIGIGTTYQGLSRMNVGEGTMGEVEEEPERVLFEMGVIGYLLVYGLRLYFLIQFWKLFRNCNDFSLKLLSLFCFLFQLQFFHFNNMIFNFTSGIFYWFFVGFLFLIPRLDTIRGAKENKILLPAPRLRAPLAT